MQEYAKMQEYHKICSILLFYVDYKTLKSFSDWNIYSHDQIRIETGTKSQFKIFK